MKQGLTALHYRIIDTLTVEGLSEEDVCGQFNVTPEQLKEMRCHPMWVKQEQAIHTKVKEVELNVNMEELVPVAIQRLSEMLEEGVDPAFQIKASKIVLEYIKELHKRNGATDSLPPLDIFVPKHIKAAGDE